MIFNQTTKLCPILTATQPYTCVSRNSQRQGKYLLGLKLTGLPLTVLCHTWAQCGHPVGHLWMQEVLEESGQCSHRMACYNPLKHTVPVIKQCMALRDNKAIESALSESSLDSVCTHRGTYYWWRQPPSPLMQTRSTQPGTQNLLTAW